MNELAGIGLANVFRGFPPREELKGLLKRHNLNCRSYLFFYLQPLKTGRDEDGNISFKALKMKKGKPKDARYVPIMNKDAADILIKHYKIAKERYDKKEFGEDLKNYAFFYDSVNPNTLRLLILLAYTELGMKEKYKPPHNLRHTLATYLVRSTGADLSPELARIVLGHEEKSTKRYNHLYDEIVEEQIRSLETAELNFDCVPPDTEAS